MTHPSPSRMFGGCYCPYIPVVTNNKLLCSDIWLRPDRKDCVSLYCVGSEYFTFDEYYEIYDDAGKLKTPRFEDHHDYKQACEDCPEGMNCARCGGKNEFFDDCGWFSIFGKSNSAVEETFEPVCEACWNACGGTTSER